MLAQLFLGIENLRITSFSLNDLKLNLDEKQYENFSIEFQIFAWFSSKST